MIRNYIILGLAHQLSLAGETSSVAELRQLTATELRTNSSQYLPFLSLSPQQFEVCWPLIGQQLSCGLHPGL